MLKIIIFSFLSILISGCAALPPNLSDIKRELKDYYSSGAFDEEVDEIAEEVIGRLEKIKLNENSAAVFDVDETALLNWDYVEKMDFGYNKQTWENWLLTSNSNRIKGVKKIYDWLIDHNVNIIFLTGRNAASYQATYQNLKNTGYTLFDTLITRSIAEVKTAAAEYKISKRKELSESGLEIILCVGDQPEDLEGDYTGLKVKIPNYLYKLGNPSIN